MRRNSSFLLSIVLLVILAPPVFSQLEEEVRVDLIEVWAKVTDKNNQLVTDLKPEDFSIYIDGKKMEVRCFDRVFEQPQLAQETPTEEGESPELAAGTKRKFVFFFDLLHTSAIDIDYLKGKIVDFLGHSFRDQGDEGMVFVLLPSLHLGVVQKMTESRDALIDVVAKMRGNPTQDARIRNNERELLEVLYAFGQAGQTTGGAQQGATSRAGETIRQARGLARTFASQEKNLSKITMNAFLSIADYLADSTYEGRLVMIYVSGGFSLRPGQNYFDMVDKALEDQAVAGTEDMLVFRDRPSNDFELEVRDAIGLLNRLNVTIYSIDANGLLENYQGADRDSRMVRLGINSVTYSQELQDSLAMVSRETGGMAFLNSQNFAKGLTEIAEDMNQQYWLCSNLPPFKKRGTYHSIDVKVARSDVKVRHRKGYVE
jgi:VWFA-related protein